MFINGLVGADTENNFTNQDYIAFNKALSAERGTDQATLVGGSALGLQSLDPVLRKVVAEEDSAVLFQRLIKRPVTNVMSEWVEQTGLGGWRGGSANTESGSVNEASGDYRRRTEFVKHLMQKRSVTAILAAQNNIQAAESLEIVNGTIALAVDAEHLLYEGDASVVPEQFNGLAAQIKSLGSSDHIIDMAGAPLQTVDPIAQGLRTIRTLGFSTGTDLFTSYNTQADLNALDPAYRILLNAQANDIVRGTNVSGINTGFGNITLTGARFLRDEFEQTPFEVRYAAIAAANAFTPAAVAIDATVSDSASKFSASWAGNYYYLVTGVNKKGESLGVLTAQTAVASGKKCVLTITPSAGGTETGYVIYRSRKNGTGALTDLREMIRVPKASSGNTVVTDLNDDLPGTTKSFILDMRANAAPAIEWASYIGMMRYNLYPTDSPIKPWIQMMSGYLQLVRPKHCMIKNIVSNYATWKPNA